MTLLFQVATIPRLPPVAASGFRALFEVFGRREIRWGLLAILLIICGHFAGFTYIRPFLERAPAFNVGAISATLLAFGIGGFFGNLLGALIAERSDKLAVTVGAFCIAAVALTLVTRRPHPTGRRRGRRHLGRGVRGPAGRLPGLDRPHRAELCRGRRRTAFDVVSGGHRERRHPRRRAHRQLWNL